MRKTLIDEEEFDPNFFYIHGYFNVGGGSHGVNLYINVDFVCQYKNGDSIFFIFFEFTSGSHGEKEFF